MKLKKQIECNSIECNSVECNSIEYEKDPMKIKFEAYDEDLSINKILWFSDLNIIVERQVLSSNSYS